MKDRAGYSTLQIALHWLIAILVLAAWFLGDQMKQRPGEVVPDGWPLHVWLGLSVLALVVLRLVVRLIAGAPAPAAGSALMARAAGLGHLALYLLLFAVPLLGMATWFGGIGATGDAHELAANLMLILAGAHAVIALFHQYVLKDGTLMRMLRPGA